MNLRSNHWVEREMTIEDKCTSVCVCVCALGDPRRENRGHWFGGSRVKSLVISSNCPIKPIGMAVVQIMVGMHDIID